MRVIAHDPGNSVTTSIDRECAESARLNSRALRGRSAELLAASRRLRARCAELSRRTSDVLARAAKRR